MFAGTAYYDVLLFAPLGTRPVRLLPRIISVIISRFLINLQKVKYQPDESTVSTSELPFQGTMSQDMNIFIGSLEVQLPFLDVPLNEADDE